MSKKKANFKIIQTKQQLPEGQGLCVGQLYGNR